MEKAVITTKGSTTEIKTYQDGRLESIKDINTRTGEVAESRVERGGGLGLFGPWKGSTK